MTMKEAAWQHRNDLEQIDWEAICDKNEDPKYREYRLGRDYQEANALRKIQNKNRSHLNKINLLAGILIAALLVGWAVEMTKEGW